MTTQPTPTSSRPGLFRRERALSLHPARLRSGQTAMAGLILFVSLAGPALRIIFGLVGWAIITAVTAVAAILWAIRWRDRLRLAWISRPLMLFTLIAALSTIWALVPAATALGTALLVITIAVAVPLATLIPWSSFLTALDHATRWILGLSLVFELWVSLFIQHPITGPFSGIEWDAATGLELWSRNLLFAGGPIQGILGNSILLCTVAALAIITLSLRLADHAVSESRGKVWLGIAIVMLILSRSSAVLIALGAVLVVAAIALLHRRYRLPGQRWALWLTVWALVAAVIAAVVFAREQVLALLGKSSDLTGRFEIWQTVIELGQERPAAGLGWLGFWPQWTEPFNDLVVRWNVVQLQAHNAWIDLWMQLGWIGVILFALMIGFTLVRAWATAAEPVRAGLDARQPWRAVSLMPLLLLTLLLVQSLTESAMLYEWGLLLLCTLAIRLTARPLERDQDLAGASH